MPLTIGVVRETLPGERRVAMVPRAMAPLAKSGVEFLVERGAGEASGVPDREYEEKGCRMAASRTEVLQEAPVVVRVRVDAGLPDGKAVIGFCDPLTEFRMMAELAARRVDAFAMELMPRITRAQSMDALSSMATIAGYKAVLLAADNLPRMFPMLMPRRATPAARRT